MLQIVQKVNEDKVLGRIGDEIYTMFSTGSQLCKEELSASSVTNAVTTDKQSSTTTPKDKKTDNRQELESTPDEYTKYHDAFMKIPEPFASIQDGHLDCTSTVDHHLDLEIFNICLIYSVTYRSGLKARDFEQLASKNMYTMTIIEPA